jgi:uncharacterized protein YjiS (DUF1127 family)
MPMATTQPLAPFAGRRAGLTVQLWYGLRRLLAAVAERDRRARARYQLTQLDERQLRDIGLTRREAEREARRHFWE